ncbi:hypothetical protein [Streptomyces sp. UNOC14_S4]|uniref:virginiamycin B lyase family protein n=1 Tax=Streptomyces sp. UNOC14_S4 TaxID=2872340 RepID=UPI001E560911|nr:hypothetical protein [Streptomyces sp. UNOC14_S4]MCC3767668.1 hypothetical protein [Streptomyces sp. UNOC14_S4]
MTTDATQSPESPDTPDSPDTPEILEASPAPFEGETHIVVPERQRVRGELAPAMVRSFRAGLAATSRTGEITRFNLGAGRAPHGVAAGPDGRAWVTSQRVGYLTALNAESGAATRYDRGNPPLTNAIVADPGPRQAMWYSWWVPQIHRDPIGSFDIRQGTYTNHILYDRGQPESMVVARNGRLYFTEPVNRWIGMINPADPTEIGEWRVPENGQPWGITEAPDGLLWFTDRQNGTIRSFDPEKGMFVNSVRFPVGGTLSYCTAAADGRVWAADNTAFVRYVNTGNLSTGSVPLQAGTRAQDVAVGPDNNVWVTVTGAVNQIACVNVRSLQAETYPVSWGAPYHITKGPGNAVWFTTPATDSVARLTVTPAETKRLDIVSGDGQSTMAGTPFPQPLRVRALSGPHEGEDGVSVSFEIKRGSAFFAATGNQFLQVTTSGGGYATAAVSARTAPGPVEITATAFGVAEPARFRLTVRAAPAHITLVGGNNQSAPADGTFATPLSVELLDSDWRPVEGAPVTFAVQPGSATGHFGGQGSVTVHSNASGIATSTALHAGPAQGTFKVDASTPSVTQHVMFDATVTGAVPQFSLSPGGPPDVTLKRSGNIGYPGVRLLSQADGRVPPQKVSVTLPAQKDLQFVAEGSPGYQLTVMDEQGNLHHRADGLLSADGQTLTFENVELFLPRRGSASTLWVAVKASPGSPISSTELTFGVGPRTSPSTPIRVTTG